MKLGVRNRIFEAMAVTLLAISVVHAQSAPANPPPNAGSTSAASAKPLLLEKNEGESRVPRLRTGDTPVRTSQFMLKVSPKNNDSTHLILGTEQIPPGAGLAMHKHMGQDGILLIQTGTAHVWLGEQERDLHAGGLVFIPSGTWVRWRNIGTEPMDLVFISSAPGIDDYFRCVTVAENETPTTLSVEERKACAEQCHIVFKPADPAPASTPAK